MLKYSILSEQKVNFDMFPVVESVKNTVHAMKFSETSSNVLRMIVESTAKKRIGGIPALLFLVGLNDKLGAQLLSSVQDS